ncbi:hypothetical protein OJAV_G00076400 [Oryzias javanicus]|uniref:Uncharacterized protein n=1 Tax=Oryzias javanicus TaxID=123683 RepID=A0A3S2UEL7_ORYJA|nr:hypothetical protein OJAV_G00076400 [Oryzias javanicus]
MDHDFQYSSCQVCSRIWKHVSSLVSKPSEILPRTCAVSMFVVYILEVFITTMSARLSMSQFMYLMQFHKKKFSLF